MGAVELIAMFSTHNTVIHARGKFMNRIEMVMNAIDKNRSNPVEAVVMRESQHQVYSCESLELKREEGETPNGNPMRNRWVLREKEYDY